MSYHTYTVACTACGALTSRAYARIHEGRCKACVTGQPTGKLCPDCGINRLSAYQVKHHYHCDACTREADPVGYANEVRGIYDY